MGERKGKPILELNRILQSSMIYSIIWDFIINIL